MLILVLANQTFKSNIQAHCSSTAVAGIFGIVQRGIAYKT